MENKAQKMPVKLIERIIKEESRTVLNESYNFDNDAFMFQQRLTNSTFYNYKGFSNDFDVDIRESDLIVTWKVGFWLNNSGIEHFFIDVEEIQGTYKVQYLNKQTDEVDQEQDKDINEIKWKFIISENVALYLNKTLYVEDLEFDFKTNVCNVNFYDYNPR